MKSSKRYCGDSGHSSWDTSGLILNPEVKPAHVVCCTEVRESSGIIPSCYNLLSFQGMCRECFFFKNSCDALEEFIDECIPIVRLSRKAITEQLLQAIIQLTEAVALLKKSNPFVQLVMQRWYSDKNFRDISDLNWYNCTVESSHATASVVLQSIMQLIMAQILCLWISIPLQRR